MSYNAREDDSDTSLEPVVERALSSTTGQDLGFDNHIVALSTGCIYRQPLMFAAVDISTTTYRSLWRLFRLRQLFWQPCLWAPQLRTTRT